MPVLQHREQIPFDINNSYHRSCYLYFRINGHWDSTAPLFNLEQPYVSIPGMIDDKLIAYYMEHEFDTKIPLLQELMSVTA